MLIIIAEGKYKDYISYHNKKKTDNKPSTYCKEKLKMQNVKSYDFVSNYFSNIKELIDTIKEYNRLANKKKGEYSLYDIIRDSYKI